jgi:uncharacterized protein (TIGR02246 family)
MVELLIIGKDIGPEDPLVTQVTQVAIKLDANWNNRDAKGFASLFTDDADFRFQNGLWVKGRKAIEEYWRENVFSLMRPSAKHTTVPSRIRFLSDSIVVGDGKLIISDLLDGEEKTLLDGEGTMILQKKNQEWLITGIRLSILTK